MQKYQQVAALFLKSTTEATQAITKANLDASRLQDCSEKELDPMLRYLESLEVHRDYLDFFQIGVYRDQKSKIEQVAKYVGLAIRAPDTSRNQFKPDK